MAASPKTCEGPIRSPSATVCLSASGRPPAAVAVVMGVSGSGKSTVGMALAQRLGWRFEEGDALHPPANVAKMRAGQALDDADRAPWLAAIKTRIDAWCDSGTRAVVTCSALKRRYRESLVADRDAVRIVYLTGSPALIGERLAARQGHFMPPSLLDSQFAALEPPTADENPILISVERPLGAIVEDIVTALSSPEASMPGANLDWGEHDGAGASAVAVAKH